MMKRHLAILLLGTALLPAPAFAQSNKAEQGKSMHQNSAAESSSGSTNNVMTKQTASGESNTVAMPNGKIHFMTINNSNIWRASKLECVDVYNDSNEKIGDITEVLVDRQGKVEAVVIGVGGFLGLGQHDVAVPFMALQWQMDDQKSAARAVSQDRSTAGMKNAPEQNKTSPSAATPAGNTTTTGTAASMSASTQSTTDTKGAVVKSKNLDAPARAILPGATKDELKKAPEFKYAS